MQMQGLSSRFGFFWKGVRAAISGEPSKRKLTFRGTPVMTTSIKRASHDFKSLQHLFWGHPVVWFGWGKMGKRRQLNCCLFVCKNTFISTQNHLFLFTLGWFPTPSPPVLFLTFSKTYGRVLNWKVVISFPALNPLMRGTERAEQMNQDGTFILLTILY